MKHIIKLIKVTLLIVFITAIAGCDTEELHKMNIDPNAVNQIDINYFLTTAELGIACGGAVGDDRQLDNNTNIRFASAAIQHLASTGQSIGEKYFNGDRSPAEYPWLYMYIDAPCRTAEIIKQTGEGGYMAGRLVNTRQAARILRVFVFHRLTDWYGSIPYSEASKGLEGIFQPKYDKQKDIYTGMLKELDEACAAFNASDEDYAGFKKADFIFDGDIAKWQKFGYSLMLRLAMRVSNVDPAMADTYVTKAVAGGTMASNDDNVWVKMEIGELWVNQNGISRAFIPGEEDLWSGYLLNKRLVDQLLGADTLSTADDDPRLMIFTGGIVQWADESTVIPIELDPTKQRGLPSGLNGSDVNRKWGTGTPPSAIPYKTFSSVNHKLLRRDSPYQIMNAAESEFLKAEALVSGIGSGITGTVKEHYDAGVKLAMQLYTVYDPSFEVTDEQVANYLAIYPFNDATALEQIGTQMWLSKFMMWWDEWSDWRRTGYPVLVPSNYPGNSTGGTIPRKLTIPATEAAGNPNYAAGATKPDQLTTKVWWDGGAE